MLGKIKDKLQLFSNELHKKACQHTPLFHAMKI